MAPQSHAEIFELGIRNPWSGEVSDLYQFPGVRLATQTGAPQTDAVQSALEELEASCEGLSERLMWLECSEAPCHVYVWGVPPHPDFSWAELTCQDETDVKLHGEWIAEGNWGGLQMVGAAIYTVDLDTPPQASLDQATLARMTDAAKGMEIYDTVLAQAASRQEL